MENKNTFIENQLELGSYVTIRTVDRLTHRGNVNCNKVINGFVELSCGFINISHIVSIHNQSHSVYAHLKGHGRKTKKLFFEESR